MKEVIRKIISLTMAFLLLASTVSWTVEKHYCMGHVVDIVFFGEAESCGMMMAMGDDMPVEQSCCSDEIITVDGQDDLKLSFEEITLEQQVFLYAFTYSYLYLSTNLEEHVVLHEEYPPPLLVRDLQLLDQVFLI